MSNDYPQPGIYRHYKGQIYQVLGIATHSETEENLVVYRACYGKRGLWVRPQAMFTQTVIVEGHSVARFERIGDDAGDARRTDQEI